jgi:hypothetical protein
MLPLKCCFVDILKLFKIILYNKNDLYHLITTIPLLVFSYIYYSDEIERT